MVTLFFMLTKIFEFPKSLDLVVEVFAVCDILFFSEFSREISVFENREVFSNFLILLGFCELGVR